MVKKEVEDQSKDKQQEEAEDESGDEELEYDEEEQEEVIWLQYFKLRYLKIWQLQWQWEHQKTYIHT